MIPKKLLGTKYRKEMWTNAEHILKKVERIIPISSAYVLGSFTTKKRRPADVDFILLVNTQEKKPTSKWSIDFVISPDNAYGQMVLADARRWMKQKYGTKKSAVIKIR